MEATMTGCQDAAKGLAERGLYVFPAPIGAKKSHKSIFYTGNGRRWGATCDVGEVQKDFDRWPDANVGIACGEASGIFVIEADTEAGHGVDGIGNLAELIEAHGPLPETWEAISPSGSWHIYFRWPEGGGITNSEGRIAPGVDVRGEGGMVIAPPSMKPGADRPYRWKNPPDRFDMGECPDWLLAMCQRPAPAARPNGSHVLDLDGSATESERAVIIDRLAVTPNTLGRDDWIKLGLALKATLGDSGRDAWIDWCYKWPDQTQGEPERVWDTARPNGRANIGTVISFLEGAGPVSASPPAEEEIFRPSSVKVKDTDYDAPTLDLLVNLRPGDMPKVTKHAQGVLRETMEYVSEGMRRDWPEAAFMISMQVIGILIGRNFETWTRLRSNLYSVVLAESGFSKSSAVEPAKELLIAAGLQHLIGPERIKSDSGLVTSIFTAPEKKKLFFLDEYGHMLQQCNARGAGGHIKQIVVEFTNLYSKANGFYSGAAYADGSRASEMNCPHVNIFGMATPGQFWAAFGSGAIEDGTLARFSIIKPTGRPERREPNHAILERMRDELAPRLSDLAAEKTAGGNLGDPVARRVLPEPAADAAWKEIGDIAESLSIEASERMPDKDIGGILARVGETAAKIALIMSVSRNYSNPVISEKDVIAGRRLAWWFAHVAIEGTMTHIADSAHQANVQKILAFIKNDMDGQCARRDVTRKFRKLSSKEIDEAIKSLMDSEELAAERIETDGRPRVIFTALRT